MRAFSWVLAIAALGLLAVCFFNEEMIAVAIPVSLLTAWIDDWACDIELRNFLDKDYRE